MQFTGELNNVSLANVLQLVASGGLTGKIILSDDPKQALICFEKGQIVHAEMEKEKGPEALMEIFLWQRGNFSFLEGDLAGTPSSFGAVVDADTLKNLIESGLHYAEQKAFLARQNIQENTILKRKADPEQVEDADAKLLLGFLDGRLALAQALAKSQLTGIQGVAAVYRLLSQGMVDVVEGVVAPKGQTINLPDWVSARLRQDNRDLSQAIVDMVIWVDRVKCWMYQADADLQVVRKNMAQCREQKDANQSTADN
jgi:hypothetical protein